MRLCMFSPAETELKRGWPGRIDGDRVVQLAAQTLQSFFTGGSAAREHAEYPLAEVLLRAPVLEPPAVRLLRGRRQLLVREPERDPLAGRLRHPAGRPSRRGDAGRAVIGLDGAIGGWTGLAEWRAPELDAAEGP